MLVGLILAKMVRVGTAVLTAWGGVCLALMLYAAFIYKIDNSSKIVFYVFLILMGVGFAVLGFYAFNHAVIISTAIIGSYAFIRGISLYAGGFPNEFQLVEMIKSGDISGSGFAFYGYLAGFAICAVGCAIFQYKMFWSSSKQDLHPYHRYRN